MKIESVPISQIIPAKYNPRKDLQPGDAEYEKLKKSIDTWDVVEPMVWNKRSGTLISGHQRYKILKARGDKEADVSVVDLDDANEKALNIALNKISGDWDFSSLADLLLDLDGLGVDLDVTGFDAPEIEDIMNWTPEPGEVKEDDFNEEPPEKPITQPGDLYELGRHRLLCGDATSSEALGVLGVDAVLCLTDPPYGVNYERSQGERGGDKVVHSGYKEGCSVDTLRFLGCVPTDVLVMTYPVDRHLFELSAALLEYGWELRKECVWVKDTFSFWPGSKYQQRHEPILVCAKNGKPLGDNIPSNASTVFEIPRPRAHKQHPTEKPIKLWSDLISHHSDSVAGVYDPFLGSGTTLIAAEQLNRTCYGMEISPQYADVIVRRYAQFKEEDPAQYFKKVKRAA